MSIAVQFRTHDHRYLQILFGQPGKPGIRIYWQLINWYLFSVSNNILKLIGSMWTHAASHIDINGVIAVDIDRLPGKQDADLYWQEIEMVVWRCGARNQLPCLHSNLCCVYLFENPIYQQTHTQTVGWAQRKLILCIENANGNIIRNNINIVA